MCLVDVQLAVIDYVAQVMDELGEPLFILELEKIPGTSKCVDHLFVLFHMSTRVLGEIMMWLRYKIQAFKLYRSKTTSKVRWMVGGAILSPKGILLKRYLSEFLLNVVLSLCASSIGIFQ